MTKRLEEEFNLPPIEDIEFNYDDEEEDTEPTLEEVQNGKQPEHGVKVKAWDFVLLQKTKYLTSHKDLKGRRSDN